MAAGYKFVRRPIPLVINRIKWMTSLSFGFLAISRPGP